MNEYKAKSDAELHGLADAGFRPAAAELARREQAEMAQWHDETGRLERNAAERRVEALEALLARSLKLIKQVDGKPTNRVLVKLADLEVEIMAALVKEGK